VHTVRVGGGVQSSLYETIDDLVPDSLLDRIGRGQLVDDLADGVYGWEIDFTRDMRPGDPFTVLFEFSVVDRRGADRILAASVRRRSGTAYVLSDDGRRLLRCGRHRSGRRSRCTGQFRGSPPASAARFHPCSVSRPHLEMTIPRTSDTHRSHRGRQVIPAGAVGQLRHHGACARGTSRPGMGVIGARADIRPKYAYCGRGHRRRHDRTRLGPPALQFLRTVAIEPPSADLGDGEPVPAARREEFERVRDAFQRLLGQPGRAVVRTD
jgi:hypothetical protein